MRDIYTHLSKAKAEIRKRRSDRKLSKKLNEFWGCNRPPFITPGGPKAVFSKSLITPNFEFNYFLDIIKEIGMRKEFWEYSHGKLVGKNKERKHLGKIYFHSGFGRNHGHKIDHTTVVNFNTDEGRMVKDISTLYGESLVDFHHNLLKKSSKRKLNIVDISEWFDRTRYLTEYYYLYYLSLFVRDYILFENFIFDNEEEGKFSKERFLPSFKKVEKMFGVKPIIVPLLPREYEKSVYWFFYGKKIKNFIRKCYSISIKDEHATT